MACENVAVRTGISFDCINTVHEVFNAEPCVSMLADALHALCLKAHHAHISYRIMFCSLPAAQQDALPARRT